MAHWPAKKCGSCTFTLYHASENLEKVNCTYCNAEGCPRCIVGDEHVRICRECLAKKRKEALGL